MTDASTMGGIMAPTCVVLEPRSPHSELFAAVPGWISSSSRDSHLDKEGQDQYKFTYDHL